MSWLQIVVLALVQGITEFLPISSSAHLILASDISGWPDQGLVFDLAVHSGTLVAVLIYFRHELAGMIRGLLGKDPQGLDMAWWLILGTLPLGITGLLLADWIETHLRSVLVIACATIGFGLVLGLAWLRRQGTLQESQTGPKRALLIGLAQVLALIPGTSRAGITLTAGLFLGLSASGAARFSFLLAIPAIALAGGYGAWQVARAQSEIDWTVFLSAAGLSALAALLCIHAFLALIERIGVLPFVVYRLALGAALLLFLA